MERIAVLRAGGLGDLLLALPAIRALEHRYPEAEIVLLGTALAAELLAPRAGAPHRVVELPRVPGVTASADERPGTCVEGFLEAQRREKYDLAVQLHGGGRFSNPLLRSLGARRTIGTRTWDAPALDRTTDYVHYQHETFRWLEVVALAGAEPEEVEPRLDALPEELAFGRGLRTAGRPMVAIHPGATDPRRRWPAERFAEVATALSHDGAGLLLLGASEEERALCGDIAARVRDDAARGAVTDLSGELTVSQLVGALASADLLIGNDSGPRHLAQALATRTASVFWCGNLLNAGPFGRGAHRVQVSWTVRCPICGRDCTSVDGSVERCGHDVSFVADVSATKVLADARALLEDALVYGHDGSCSGHATSSRISQ